MNKIKYYIVPFLLFAHQAFAEGTTLGASITQIPIEVLLLITLLVFTLFVLITLIMGLSVDVGRMAYESLKAAGKEMPILVKLFGIFDGDNQALTGVYHDEEIEGHTYDGITEYDNDLPPWWIGLFYITIVFAVVYIGYYHVYKDGNTMEEEYQAEVALAEVMYADVDIEYEAPTTDEEALATAKQIFIEKCAACHKADGGGAVGPNLTDNAWIHGGGINDVYKTIKHGVIEKGMIPWKNDYNNQQLYEIASYVLSLQGTNPPGAKAPQGEVYEAK